MKALKKYTVPMCLALLAAASTVAFAGFAYEDEFIFGSGLTVSADKNSGSTYVRLQSGTLINMEGQLCGRLHNQIVEHDHRILSNMSDYILADYWDYLDYESGRSRLYDVAPSGSHGSAYVGPTP